MSLEVTSDVTNKDSSGYDQVTSEVAASNSTSGRSSSSGQESRSDRNLKSVSSSARTSASKTHIAFNLSFKIEIKNRTPFDPSKIC